MKERFEAATRLTKKGEAASRAAKKDHEALLQLEIESLEDD